MSVVAVKCETCKTKPHHDYFQCGACGQILGTYIPKLRNRDEPYRFCPACGETLGEFVYAVPFSKTAGNGSVPDGEGE